MTYFRIQPAARPVAELLDQATWESRQWFGEKYVDCCHDTDCPDCDGTGEREDVRRGVSTCASIEDLVAYFRQVGVEFDDTVLVELDADRADDLDHDHELGAVLVHPYRIVSTTPTPEHVIDAILA
ncbi:hypothetical protein AB0425_17650 [Actinosynnema sp. NPDC051121]